MLMSFSKVLQLRCIENCVYSLKVKVVGRWQHLLRHCQLSEGVHIVLIDAQLRGMTEFHSSRNMKLYLQFVLCGSGVDVIVDNSSSLFKVHNDTSNKFVQFL